MCYITNPDDRLTPKILYQVQYLQLSSTYQHSKYHNSAYQENASEGPKVSTLRLIQLIPSSTSTTKKIIKKQACKLDVSWYISKPSHYNN